MANSGNNIARRSMGYSCAAANAFYI